jgi:hypothetical protein
MPQDRIPKRDDAPGHQLEKIGPANTRYNETVRANNKRSDAGKPMKNLPRGKAGDRTWKASGR